MKLLPFMRYIEACVTSPDWLDKFHSFFSASYFLAKESERFIFLGSFCNLLVQSFLNFQCRVGWLFCENDQKWPKTKHCFDTSDSSDTFDRSDSNERFWQIFTNAEGWGLFTRENSGCTIKLIKFCSVTFLMRSFKDKIIYNKQVDYNSDLLSNLDWQATIFLIHDVETRVRMFKNMGGNNPGGNLLGGNFPGGVWWVEIFPVGAFLIPYLINCEVIL